MYLSSLDKNFYINSKVDNDFFLNRQDKFESNVRSYPRKFALAIKSAKGAIITDVEDNTYIDCLAGAGTLALGHNHPKIQEAIIQTIQTDLPLHTLDITTPLKDEFSEQMYNLLSTDEQEYCLQFCGPTGADAVEAALKLAKKVTGRTNIISFSGGYHGMSHGALSITGNLSPKEGIEGLMTNVQFMPYPNEYRCAFGLTPEQSIDAHCNYFENFLMDVESGVAKPAAVILEAIQGEGGVNPAPVKWLQRIREITKKLGIVLIIDEVQTGFCRTGNFFAYQHAGIDPDIVVMSKAIGGGLPLALIGIKKELDAWQAGNHSGTFRGNQLAMATGLVTLKYFEEHNIADKAKELGNWLISELNLLREDYPQIGQVRGRGLMVGIEIVNPNADKQVDGSYPVDGELSAQLQKTCFDNGLIIEKGGRHGSVLRFLPPLIITKEQLAEAVTKLREALEQHTK